MLLVDKEGMSMDPKLTDALVAFLAALTALANELRQRLEDKKD